MSKCDCPDSCPSIPCLPLLQDRVPGSAALRATFLDSLRSGLWSPRECSPLRGVPPLLRSPAFQREGSARLGSRRPGSQVQPSPGSQVRAPSWSLPPPHPPPRGLLLSLGPECTGGCFSYPHCCLPQHPTLPSSRLSVSMETRGEGMALPRETHGRPLEQRMFTSRGLVPAGQGQVPARSGLVRSLFLACSLLAVSSQGRSRSSGLPLFSQGHESRWGPTLMTSKNHHTGASVCESGGHDGLLPCAESWAWLGFPAP